MEPGCRPRNRGLNKLKIKAEKQSAAVYTAQALIPKAQPSGQSSASSDLHGQSFHDSGSSKNGTQAAGAQPRSALRPGPAPAGGSYEVSDAVGSSVQSRRHRTDIGARADALQDDGFAAGVRPFFPVLGIASQM